VSATATEILLFRCIQTDESFAILLHGSFSLCLRPYAGQSGATLARRIPQGRAACPTTNIRF
jgi:hypothetical protein